MDPSENSFSDELAAFHFNVSNSICNFTGRGENLKQLADYINKDDSLTVVSGMGGVGKTCLVRHFVNMDEVAGWNILWLEAETEVDLKKSITKAATALNKLKRTKLKFDWDTENEEREEDLGNWKQNNEEQLAEFYSVLHSLDRKTLLIFDNADDKHGNFSDKQLAKYLSISMKKHNIKPGYKHPYIVVTARRETVLKQFQPKQIKMCPLADDEALSLCEKSLKRYESSLREEVKCLCSCLANYPLAIQQAVAYLNEMMGYITISDFIEIFRKSVRVFEEKEAEVDHLYSYTVATVFDLSLKIIEKTENALEMMCILSFCDAEKTRIWLFEVLFGETSAKKAIAVLVKLK